MDEKTWDQIYSKKKEGLKPFTFDQEVATVFQNMIERSVPGYEMCLQMIALISKTFLQPGERVYDLGCSLGAGLIAVSKGLKGAPLELIGVDNSASMLEKCRANLKTHKLTGITLIETDIETIKLKPCSAVILNFTLQFLSPEKRNQLIEKIYRALLPEGILILSEKVAFSNSETSDILSTLHEKFKVAHGYSQLEISQKRTALEKVLIPETEKIHLERLSEAGFKQCVPWFQCFNFASYLAIKTH